MHSVSVSYTSSTTLTRAQISSNLSNSAFRLLAVFQLVQSETKEKWVRQQCLADELGVSVATIRRGLKELVAKGFLSLCEHKFLGRFKRYIGKQVRHIKSEQLPEKAPEAPDVLVFPKPLEDAIAAVRRRFASPSERSKAILETIAQHMPASFFYDNAPPTVVATKPLPPAVVRHASVLASIAELEAEFKRTLNSGSPTFLSDSLQIRMRIQALEAKHLRERD